MIRLRENRDVCERGFSLTLCFAREIQFQKNLPRLVDETEIPPHDLFIVLGFLREGFLGRVWIVFAR